MGLSYLQQRQLGYDQTMTGQRKTGSDNLLTECDEPVARNSSRPRVPMQRAESTYDFDATLSALAMMRYTNPARRWHGPYTAGVLATWRLRRISDRLCLGAKVREAGRSNLVIAILSTVRSRSCSVTRERMTSRTFSRIGPLRRVRSPIPQPRVCDEAKRQKWIALHR